MTAANLTPPDSPRWLIALAEEPALVVLLLAGVVGLIAGTVLLRLRRAVRQARARGALEDWLLGAEEALCGQFSSARERLQRVVAQDPENHGARILLAETLLALDEPAAAHGHLLALTEAFAVVGRRVQRGLVQALVDSGRIADAAERLRAVPRGDDDFAGLRRRLAVELAAGLRKEAAQTGSLLLAQARGAEDVAFAQAAVHAPPRPEAAPAAARAGTRVRLPKLLTGGAPAAVTVSPAPSGAIMPAASAAEARLQQFAAAAATAPYVCGSCGATLERSPARCPYCDARNSARLQEPRLHRELASVSAAADEIEENEAHLHRLLERTLVGDEEARRALVEIGSPAVAIVFAHAVANSAARPALIEVMQAMGSTAMTAVLAAYERARGGKRPTSAAGTRQPALTAAPAGPQVAAEIVGRVVQSYGPTALPAFAGYLDTDDHDLRKIVVDFYLGLDDVEELQAVLERYPPVEVIQRLNATPAARLQAWLGRVPEHGLLAEVVLVNQMFLRDEDMLLAAAQSASPTALLAILMRRGSSHDLATFAVGRLGDASVAPVAAQLLRAYGVAAADALLAGYLDLDRAPAARAHARALLVEIGAAVVPQVCQCFGASPARLDDELIALLVAFGVDAVEPLAEAYRRRNLLERVGGRLVRRYNHPRNAIVKVLARIGGPTAQAALLALRASETDQNLKLRLEQGLQVAARTPTSAYPAVLPSEPASAAREANERKEGVG